MGERPAKVTDWTTAVQLIAEGGGDNGMSSPMAANEEKPELRAGFARLVGLSGIILDYNFQKYEVILGRKSKSANVDVVLGAPSSPALPSLPPPPAAFPGKARGADPRGRGRSRQGTA